DRLALKRRAHGVDLDLVTRPVVAVAERFFDRLEVGSVEHHWLRAFEMQNRLLFRVLALPDQRHFHVLDRGNDRRSLGISGLEILRRKRLICTHCKNSVSLSFSSSSSLSFSSSLSLVYSAGGASSDLLMRLRTTIGVVGAPKRVATCSIHCA